MLYARRSSGGGGDELFKLAVSGNLTVITAEMLDGIATIGNNAFSVCSSLASVEIPNSVISIVDNAFYQCTSLTSIEIPNSVTSLGGYAFLGCSALESVTVRATTPPTLGTGVFPSTSNNLKIYVPSASVSAYKAATNWSSYSSKIQAIPA